VPNVLVVDIGVAQRLLNKPDQISRLLIGKPKGKPAPLAGIVAGLRAARNDVVVVIPVDTPLLTKAALHDLADACRDVAVPPSGPLPGAYRRSTLPVLERALLAGHLAVREAIAGLDVAVVDLETRLLTNVNTADDVRRL